jgi:hypothetical protein
MDDDSCYHMFVRIAGLRWAGWDRRFLVFHPQATPHPPPPLSLSAPRQKSTPWFISSPKFSTTSTSPVSTPVLVADDSPVAVTHGSMSIWGFGRNIRIRTVLMSCLLMSSTAPSTLSRASFGQNVFSVVNRLRRDGSSRSVTNPFDARTRLTNPLIFQLLGGTDDAFVREISFVDPVSSLTTVTSVNLSLSQYVSILEKISYERSPVAPDAQTTFKQTAEIQARMGLPLWRAVGGQLEKWCTQRFGDNAKLGRDGLEFTLRQLWERQKTQQPQLA